ncbi:peroxidase 5-like [Asparagus officinalis]|uniref:peroxidase 5-like n=1 Tax=Asparagus officinalis TaxID=4686 RepID=UPI00098E3FD7|nr:peroxidase 5-like [Asparagus officinalis]
MYSHNEYDFSLKHIHLQAMGKGATHSFMLIFIAIFAAFLAEKSSSSLEADFYKSTCPLAEKIVRKIITKAIVKDHGLAASLIRMHFHDCFVRGCDASILLDSIPGSKSEKLSIANNPSLQGYEVIDRAKAAVEAQCPQTVSCADIIAFAARDSTTLTGGAGYSVPAGRRDGRISNESEVLENLPFPTFTSTQLIQNFAKKGLSAKDMVTLSGAHSIGVSHCSSFTSRLYSFNSTHTQDPSMNPKFAKFLKTKCLPISKAAKRGLDPLVALDVKGVYHLDVKYYENLMKGKGLLRSDQTLVEDPWTAWMVERHVESPEVWREEFAAAMVKMGRIGVLTGNQGEIRKNCRVVN